MEKQSIPIQLSRQRWTTIQNLYNMYKNMYNLTDFLPSYLEISHQNFKMLLGTCTRVSNSQNLHKAVNFHNILALAFSERSRVIRKPGTGYCDLFPRAFERGPVTVTNLSLFYEEGLLRCASAFMLRNYFSP